MTRPAISSITDTRTAITSRGERWNTTNGVRKLVGTWTSNQNPSWGTVQTKQLSETYSNPLHPDGWRSPSPYYGRDDMATYTRPAECKRTYYVGSSKVEDIIVEPKVPYLLSVPTDPDTSYYIQLAQQSVLEKFSEKTIDLSVAFAERKATANLATDSMQTIAKLWRAIRRKNPSASLDEIGNLWLSYRYGWSPTISDVYGALQALDDQSNGKYTRYRITQNSTKTNVFEKKSERTLGIYGGSLQVLGKASSKTKVETTVNCRMDASYDGSTLQRLSDVGVTDPASTTWELLPYSFVVDWFVGVGGYLSGLHAFDAYQFKAMSTTVHRKYETSLEWTPQSTGVTGGGKLAELKGTSFNRYVSFTPPPSRIVVKPNPMNMTRFADSVALLRGLFSGRRS